MAIEGDNVDRDFRFRGGSAALDLTATLGGRLREAPREMLQAPADLGRWFVAAGLVSSAPAVTQKELDAARALREAIFTLAEQAGTSPLDPGALTILNRAAAQPPAAPALQPDGSIALEPAPAGLLALLAREAILLLKAGSADRLRQCQSPTCAILFVDNTRSGDRRWCSMAACGNKAKVAEHRSRKKGG